MDIIENTLEQPKIKKTENMKEYMKNYKKEWNEKNKDHIKTYLKKYYEEHSPNIKVQCDCGMMISKSCLSRHKKKNSHKILLENIEKPKNDDIEKNDIEKPKNDDIEKPKKIKCDCGVYITKYNLKTHQKTDKHKQFLQLKTK